MEEKILSQETMKCKNCGRDLPLEMFRVSKLGRHKTCNECVTKRQKEGKERKKAIEEEKNELENARLFRLKDFTPRELMAELKHRGYESVMKFTEVHVIDSKDIKV